MKAPRVHGHCGNRLLADGALSAPPAAPALTRSRAMALADHGSALGAHEWAQQAGSPPSSCPRSRPNTNRAPRVQPIRDAQPRVPCPACHFLAAVDGDLHGNVPAATVPGGDPFDGLPHHLPRHRVDRGLPDRQRQPGLCDRAHPPAREEDHSGAGAAGPDRGGNQRPCVTSGSSPASLITAARSLLSTAFLLASLPVRGETLMARAGTGGPCVTARAPVVKCRRAPAGDITVGAHGRTSHRHRLITLILGAVRCRRHQAGGCVPLAAKAGVTDWSAVGLFLHLQWKQISGLGDSRCRQALPGTEAARWQAAAARAMALRKRPASTARYVGGLRRQGALHERRLGRPSRIRRGLGLAVGADSVGTRRPALGVPLRPQGARASAAGPAGQREPGTARQFSGLVQQV
jgi:hypothetical protein